MNTDPAFLARRAHVKAHVPILEVLRVLGVRLSGEGTQQIRCPFHEDRSPSARVYVADGEDHVHCFTCAKSWDSTALIAQKLGLPLEAALEWLEHRFTVPPVSAQIDQRVRMQLRLPLQAPLDPSYTHVEARLIASRQSLGLGRYSRLLLALDLVQARQAHGVMTAQEAREWLTRILAEVSDAESTPDPPAV